MFCTDMLTVTLKENLCYKIGLEDPQFKIFNLCKTLSPNYSVLLGFVYILERRCLTSVFEAFALV